MSISVHQVKGPDLINREPNIFKLTIYNNKLWGSIIDELIFIIINFSMIKKKLVLKSVRNFEMALQVEPLSHQVNSTPWLVKSNLSYELARYGNNVNSKVMHHPCKGNPKAIQMIDMKPSREVGMTDSRTLSACSRSD